ncbi:MAG: sugar phosphate isomerase/epimerase family protein [Chthoniobacteraceae bacterium]
MKSWCQLAVITDEVSQDLDTVLAFAQEFQLDGIELRSLLGKAFKDLTRTECVEIGRRAGEAGLAIPSCATPVFKCDLESPVEIEQHVELFRRSVDIALDLECTIIRVFNFLRRSHPSTNEDLIRAAEVFSQLIPIVQGTDLRIGLENEASCLCATGEETARFLSHLPPSPRVGVVWDPCNVLYVDGTTDPVHDEFPQIASRVVHVHLKDARRRGERAADTCVELGTGELDFPAQLSLLKQRGYADWISLETHWRTVPLDGETVHLPGGAVFSRDAEPASRICMTNLQRLVAAA